MTLMPALAKVSGSTVVDLVKWAESGTPWDTNKYFYGDAGNLYKETSGGVWSVDRTVSGGAGQGLLAFDNYLYYSTATTLGRKGPLDNSPSFNDDFLSDGTTELDQSLDTSGNTYSLTNAINEGATHRQTFTPTRDPLRTIQILVANKGTGDWTVTVHDASNNTVGTVTTVNASVTGSTDNSFTFSTPLRLIIGNDYHFHVTSSNSTGTVTTTTASDLETVDFHTYFGILISDTQWHPMINHLNFLVIGNERYLAVWDQATYNPNQITFAPGFKVRALTIWKEFVVAACWRGSSVDAVEEGRLYYWDGISDTFNWYETINLGLPNALHTTKNRVFGIYGSRGMMHLHNEPFKKLQEAPYLGRGKKVEVYPGGITEWQGKTYLGLAGSTDDGTTLQQGIYEFGNRTDDLPEALTLGMTISTGTTTSTSMKIGCVKAFGVDMYVGWKDGSTYGVDKVSETSSAATSGSYEQLIYDAQAPQSTHVPVKVVISFLPLVSGESVTPKYRLNRAASWTSGDTVSTVGEVRAELILDIVGRTKEIEYGFDVASSNGTFPTITGVFFMVNNLEEETPES